LPDNRAKWDRARQEKEQKQFDELPEDQKAQANDQKKKDSANLSAFRAIAEKNIKGAYQEYECPNDPKSWCIKIPLSKMATLFSNGGFQSLQTLLPGFPGSHNTAQYFYYAGLTTLLFSVIICLVNLLGCGYLYYYSEHKATKTARKGALISFIASPVMAILIIFLLVAVVLVAGSSKNSAPWTMLFSSQSQVFPKQGFWIIVFNMIVQWMLVVFSRFWRMKRAERVRKQRKDDEEDEEFMRLMGIDPQAAFEDSSGEESSSDESDDDMETASGTGTQRSSAFTPSTAPFRPMVVQSQPVSYGYNTVAPQQVVIGGGQPNVQRVYL